MHPVAGLLCVVTDAIDNRRPALARSDRHAGHHGDRRRIDLSNLHQCRNGIGHVAGDRRAAAFDEFGLVIRARHLHRNRFCDQRATAPVCELRILESIRRACEVLLLTPALSSLRKLLNCGVAAVSDVIS